MLGLPEVERARRQLEAALDRTIAAVAVEWVCRPHHPSDIAGVLLGATRPARRSGAPTERGTVGGRTTWRCSTEQA